jgi:hypothetical protein
MLGATSLLALGLFAGQAEAAPPPARFALVLGVNAAPRGEKLPPLRYADDDAARYFDLFRSLGASASLLTSPDENTRRLHPQASAEAGAPTKAAVRSAVQELRARIEKARARGHKTEAYVVYAGHGTSKGGRAYLTLEDGRLSARAVFDDVIAGLGADRSHLIVDACYSYFFALHRGPGGSSREASGFLESASLATERGPVGLLLSTSTASRTHEWEEYQAGVFSHEVRSGLYGAADADGDGVISYDEIGAFVERANAKIENERFRPRVFSRPPAGDDALADLRPSLGRAIEVDGERSGHWFLEDARGVRLADVHNAKGQPVRLVRPGADRLYLARADGEVDFVIEPAAGDVVKLASLTPGPPRPRSRGAAQEAFGKLFTSPFHPVDVERYEPVNLERLRVLHEADLAAESEAFRQALSTTFFISGLATVGLGTVIVGGGVAGILYSDALRYSGDPDVRDSALPVEIVSTSSVVVGAAVAGGGMVLAFVLRNKVLE